MKRTLTTVALLACFLGAPAFTRSAEAHSNDSSGYGHVDYRYRDGYRYDRAWSIVRHDPCRYAEYRRAAYHRNPVKRRRTIERLAYEGCQRRAAQRYYR